MTATERFAAQLLEAGARGYAALAVSTLLERRPDLETLDGAQSAGAWRAHLVQRILELQTSVSLGRPHLFVERVRWSRRAYHARNVPEDQLHDALQSLRETLAEELPPNVGPEVLDTLDRALADFERPVDPEERELDPESALGRQALLYLLSTLEGRTRDAIDALLAARRDDEIPLRSCVLDILVPAQREIGRLWHLGDSDIAEEHLVTATTKRALAALAYSAPAAPANGLRLMTAAVEGDDHDVGGQALSVLAEDLGWRTVDLGADVPTPDLVSARIAFTPDVVVVSATLSTHLTVLERSVRALRAEAGGDVKIVVAGAAAANDTDLPLSWGADAVVDSVEGAIRQLEAWTPEEGGASSD